MNIVLRQPWTVEQFLQWEDRQEGRHEFDGTRIVEMTGGSRAHQQIVANLIRFFEDHLDLSRFDAVQAMRIAFDGKVRYPGIAVVAGAIESKVKTLRDALVLFEVLSDDTAPTDLVDKRDEYARLPSVRHYVLLEQNRISLTVLERVQDGWRESQVTEGTLDLPELGVTVPLSAIYRRALAADQPDYGPGAPTRNCARAKSP